MPGVVTVARSRTGRDISNNCNLLSPVSSTHSRPLSHDSTHSGFVLKLKVNFSLKLKYYSFIALSVYGNWLINKVFILVIVKMY